MMKKSYISPKMDILQLKMQAILVVSDPSYGGGGIGGSGDAPGFPGDPFELTSDGTSGVLR